MLGIVFVIVSITSTPLLDKYGRRKLIIFGCYILALVTICICVIGFVGGAENFGMKVLFIIWPSLYAAGLSPATFLYVSEVLPEVGVSIA